MRLRSIFPRARAYFRFSFFGTVSSFSSVFCTPRRAFLTASICFSTSRLRSSIFSSVISSSEKMTSSRMVR